MLKILLYYLINEGTKKMLKSNQIKLKKNYMKQVNWIANAGKTGFSIGTVKYTTKQICTFILSCNLQRGTK